MHDPTLWSGKLVGAMVITFIVQGVTIGAYAARLAGVQTKRIATSISLFNLFMTAGRLANLFMVFFVGPLSDGAGRAVTQASDPAVAAAWQHNFAACTRSKRAVRYRTRWHGSLYRATSWTFCARNGCRALQKSARSIGACCRAGFSSSTYW